jgi:hypothetical protein
MRFWMFASVVSNARAISAVLKPQSVRNAMAADEEQAKRFVPDLVGEMRFERRRFSLGIFGHARQCLGVGSFPPQRVDRQVAGGTVEPASRVFRHSAPGPGFQGLHERSLNDVLDEFKPANAERPGQHSAEPAGLVAKKVLHQCARFAHASSVHRFLPQRDDPYLFGAAQFFQHESGRPHCAFAAGQGGDSGHQYAKNASGIHSSGN